MEKLTKDEIFVILKPLIADRLSVEEKEVTMTSHFKNDLGADSLDTVELSMEFEKEFKINILDDDLEKVFTVEDAINTILNELSKR